MYYFTILIFCQRVITIYSVCVDDRALCNVVFEGILYNIFGWSGLANCQKYLVFISICCGDVHICSWNIPLNLEGSPLWRAFLCFKAEPLEDLRTYVSSNSIVPDSCIFFASKYFSSILRNLERFRRAAVLWIGTNRQGVDTDLYKLIYIDLQKRKLSYENHR